MANRGKRKDAVDTSQSASAHLLQGQDRWICGRYSTWFSRTSQCMGSERFIFALIALHLRICRKTQIRGVFYKSVLLAPRGTKSQWIIIKNKSSFFLQKKTTKQKLSELQTVSTRSFDPCLWAQQIFIERFLECCSRLWTSFGSGYKVSMNRFCCWWSASVLHSSQLQTLRKSSSGWILWPLTIEAIPETMRQTCEVGGMRIWLIRKLDLLLASLISNARGRQESNDIEELKA